MVNRRQQVSKVQAADTNVLVKSPRGQKAKTAYPPKPPSIYFGGCSFGAAFYIGVHEAMVEMWGLDYYKDIIIGGGSAGTIIAIGIALGKDTEYLDKLYRYVAEEAVKYGPVYYASYFMEKGVRKMLEEEGPYAFKKLEGRLCFGTTEFFDKHRWHMSWESNEDFLACVQGTSHIPFYCMRNQPIKGIEVVDGAYGFAGRDLLDGDDTLYVGIDPHAEITRHFTNSEMFFPQVGDHYDSVRRSGYDAMMAWDGKMNKKVGFRQPNYPALYVLWFLKFFEVLIYRGIIGTSLYVFQVVVMVLNLLLVPIGFIATKTF